MKPRPKKRKYTLPTIVAAYDPIVVGLDISLSNTGVVCVGAGADVPRLFQRTFKTDAKEPHVSRCLSIASYLACSRIALTTSPQDVVFVREDYAYGAQGIADVKLKELGGVVAAKFYEAGHQLHSMPIASWKKFITGKGDASKDLVKSALTELLGDEAVKDWTEHDFDAAGVALTARAALNHKNLAKTTAYQDDVIEKIRESVNSLVLLAV